MTETEIKQGLKTGELWGGIQGGAKQLIEQDGQKSKVGRYILQQK